MSKKRNKLTAIILIISSLFSFNFCLSNTNASITSSALTPFANQNHQQSTAINRVLTLEDLVLAISRGALSLIDFVWLIMWYTANPNTSWEEFKLLSDELELNEIGAYFFYDGLQSTRRMLQTNVNFEDFIITVYNKIPDVSCFSSFHEEPLSSDPKDIARYVDVIITAVILLQRNEPHLE